MGQNTVIEHIRGLEKLGFLEVNREDRKYNIYTIPDFVSANAKPTASEIEATASEIPQTASENDQTASIRGGLTREPENQNNQNAQNSIQEALEYGNKKMDTFLENERKAQASGLWTGREKIPESIRELLDVYVQITGQRPGKKDLMDWLQTGNEWLDMGATAQDVRDAYKKSKPETGQGFTVARPGSLTRVMGALIGERRATGGNEWDKFVKKAREDQNKIKDEGVEL
jgi:coenzyme F420-reducing hydrogenase alpha subunit